MPAPADRLTDRPLSPDEYRRYGRHLALAEVGEAGQRKLRASSVLVVGAGGLGSPAALYLAAAGVGRITLADFDVVDPSNLQRQVLFSAADVGRPKVHAAAERLRALNPLVEIAALEIRVDASNATELVASHDVVVDGSDSFTTRYLVNDACFLAERPYVYGSIFRFEGQASLFRRPGPCYRCLFPEPPPPGLVPNCSQAGVLGVLPGVVGSVQAAEALKALLGLGPTLEGRLLLVDLLGASFREVRLRRDPACALCGDAPSIRALSDVPWHGCGVGGADAEGRVPSVRAAELAILLASGAPPVVVDVREAWEFHAGAIAGSVNVPLGEISGAAPGFAGRDVVVVCRNGLRAARAAELLAENGIAGARNLEGGLLAWREEAAPELVVA
ncbi:MAG: putative adenylyltransferase/sulfurtransferase MoeZ [Planctomycetes bacterium]|nr:putative adenylyltransferase/sulfurtransferase MoeZ [Planctomycetota bacterium]